MNRKRMYAAAEFDGERLIDHAVALQSGLPLERLRHDIDAKMGLAARPMTGMPAVLIGFIDHA